MRTRERIFPGIGFLALIAVVVDANAYPVLRPSWMGDSFATLVQPGSSYLGDLTPTNDFRLRDSLMEGSDVRGMRETVENLQSTYERKRHQGLADTVAQRDYFEGMQGVRDLVVRQVSQREVQKHERRLNSMIKQTPSSVRALAGIAGALAMVYYNRPFRLRLSPEARLEARTSVLDRAGTLDVFTPFLHGAVNLSMSAPSSFREAIPQPGQERLRFSLWRELPIVNFNGGVSYGSTSTLLTASIQKPIGDRLKCIVDSSHALDSDFARIRSPEDNVRLEYQLRF